MTQKAIKEQFQTGDRWQVIREGGNNPRPCDEVRTVARVQVRCLVTIQPDGKEIDTDWPWRDASEIIEAIPGKLKFKYPDGGPIVSLTELEGVTQP